MKFIYSGLLVIFCVFQHSILRSQNIQLIINEDKACFTEGVDSILCYQIAETSFDGTYKRSNYIHPLYTLDGAVITEDFPEDHLHHRGIFWSWHQLYVGDKRIGDPWEIKDFCWDVNSVKQVELDGNAKSIQSEVYWKSPLWRDKEGLEKPVVKETTTITVHPSNKNFRTLDVEIILLALEEEMRIGGSEDPKGYGGFSPRVRLVEDTEFASNIGDVQPTNLPVAASPWMDISGSYDEENGKSGIAILSHPDNPGYPNPWILRSKNSMQNAVFPHPGAEAIPLSDTVPIVLRYRLIVHKGDRTMIDLEQLHAVYSEQ